MSSVENFVEMRMIQGRIRAVYADGDGNEFYIVDSEHKSLTPYAGDPAICPACGSDPMLCECVTPWSEE